MEYEMTEEDYNTQLFNKYAQVTHPAKDEKILDIGKFLELMENESIPLESQVDVQTAEALQIVKDLAKWSEQHPRARIYSYNNKEEIELQLHNIEKRAKDFVSNFSD